MPELPKSRLAFTFIELSIVLVIIGLVVGGILVGRDLVRGYEIRAVIREMEEFKTAINTFRTKYNALPGDYAEAESIWGSDAGCPDTPANTMPKTVTCNGDGNGWIGRVADLADTTHYYESYRIWQHLANAGLIAGQYTGAYIDGLGNLWWEAGINVPGSKLSQAAWLLFYMGSDVGGGIYFLPQARTHTFHLVPNSYRTSDGFKGAIAPRDALSLDTKIDDGMIAEGFVTARKNPLGCSNSNISAGAQYDLSQDGPICHMLIDGRF